MLTGTSRQPASDVRTMVDILRSHAAIRGDRPAYAFLADGEAETARLTFAETDLRARAIAATLQDQGANGERVLIAYPSGLDYVVAFLGCLYAGAVAVPCDAPNRPAAVERLQAIRADARPALMLAPEGDPGESMPRLDVAVVPDAAAAEWRPPRSEEEDLALLQYTSGSTRSPRGVMVTHGNVLANEAAIAARCEHDEDSTFVGWLPLFHDMGMIANVLQPLYLGSLSVLMPPTAFLEQPVRWLRALSRYRAVTSGGPNFGYDLCASRIPPAARKELDLSAWRVAFNGAEPVRPATLRHFAEAFAVSGFRPETFFPCYGLAEATLIVAGAPRGRPLRTVRADPTALRAGRLSTMVNGRRGGVPLCTNGPAVRETRIAIVDPSTRRTCPPGVIGEIWLAGPGIARGYWNDPAATEETFGNHLANGAGPYLRTGDLGTFSGGELVVAGRIKDLIIIRGQNHHPADLERTAESAHPALRPACGAAFAVEPDGQERLVIAYELNRGSEAADLEDIARAVRSKIAKRHGAEVHAMVFVERGGIPKTTSGKVRRQACREAFLAGTAPVIDISWRKPERGVVAEGVLPTAESLAVLAPDERPAVLATALCRTAVARYGAPAGNVTSADPVSALGLDSLTATELQYTLQDAYDVVLPSLAFLGDLTFIEIAERVLESLDAPAADDHSSEPADPTAAPAEPLSPMQLALWFDQAAAGSGLAYVLSRVLRLRGDLDRDALARALARTEERHSALRARFEQRDEGVFQVIAGGPGELLEEDCERLTDVEVAERLETLCNQPFSLTGERLFRAFLLRRSHDVHYLILSAHHAVMDFWSFCVVVRDLRAFYGEERGEQAANLSPLAPRPARPQPEPDDAEYWSARLADVSSSLEIPLDRPRPASRALRGADVRFAVGPETVSRLQELGERQRTTLFTVLLAAYQTFLSRYAGQRDIVVGTLASGRDHRAFADVVGCFTNPIPVRATFEEPGREPGESFHDLLGRVRHDLLADLAHADYPFSTLVAALRPERDPGRPVLVQTMLTLQREPRPTDEGLRALALGVEGTLPFATGLDAESVPVRQFWTHLDLTINLAVIGGELRGVAEYDTDILDEATVVEMIDRFTDLLRSIADEPDDAVTALAMLGPSGSARALEQGTGPRRPRPPGLSLHGLVDEQARRTPDRVAVTMPIPGRESVQLSFGLLIRWSESLAARLAAHGVGVESRVGVLMERSVALPAALLAILRLGAAYVPLNPQDPPARLTGIVEDAGIAVIVAGPGEPVPQGVVVIRVEPGATTDRGVRRSAPVHPEQAAYVMHTSGSTGRPKGVTIPHRAIVNRLLWAQEEYGLTREDRVLHKASATFDVSVWELFWPLISGAGLVLAAPGRNGDDRYLATTMEWEQVTTAHFVPTLLTSFLDEVERSRTAPATLRLVVSSGEALTERHRRRFADLLPGDLHNLYGPTEAAVDVTAWRGTGPVTIGTPITGIDAHVLDPRLEPLPPRVVGELFLGGVALARGYLGMPALTALAFPPDPRGDGTRLYRTGDLARRNPEGAIEHLGRTDSQIKIMGVRVEPGEVEEALRSLPDITDAVVKLWLGNQNGPYLVAYVLPRARASSAEPDVPLEVRIRRNLRRLLPAAMVPASVVLLDEIPRTASGKPDRSALPAPRRQAPDERPDSFGAPAPRSGLERRLADLFATSLGLAAVGIDDDFHVLGGDSIVAIRLVASARSAGIAITVADLVRCGTIRRLAEAIGDEDAGRRVQASTPEKNAAFELCAPLTAEDFPDSVEDAYPISFAQRALLFQETRGLGYEVYVTSLRVRSAFHERSMRRAAQSVLERHAYLRSSFDLTRRAEPLQLVHRDLAAELAVTDLSAVGPYDRDRALAEWATRERTRRFDVVAGPLVRFHVHRLGADEFQVTVSSFALDGWCSATVLTELLTDYRAFNRGIESPNENPQVGYRDFVALERLALDSEADREFWANEIAEMPAALLTRHVAPETEGDEERLQRRVVARIDPRTQDGLRALAARLAVPLKSVLLAAHLRVVGRHTGLTLGTTGLEVNGRPEDDGGDQVVGVFNNVVPFLADDVGGTWADLVEAVFEAETRALPHRRYPYARLNREHRLQELFDTLFVFTHFHVYDRLAGLEELEVLAGEAPDQTYFPLTAHFNVETRAGGLRLLLDYDPRSFSPEYVTGLASRYERALRAMATDPDRPYRDEDLLSEDERRPLPASGVATASTRASTVHQAVLEQATRTPDAIAVADVDGQLSYRMLALRSARLAAFLRGRGIGPSSLVAVHGPRSTELVVAILGVLRSGAAYVPIDEGLPRHRVARMLETAEVSLVLSAKGEPAGDRPVVRWNEWEEATAVGPLPSVRSEERAYAIFTSGSTGPPKIVDVPHRAAIGYFAWCEEAYGIGVGSRSLVHSPVGFDLTLTALLAPLTVGGRVTLLEGSDAVDGLGEALTRFQPDLLKITPAHFEAVAHQVEAGVSGPYLGHAVVGGEQLRRAHLERWWGLVPGLRIINEYGPTEATVGCCASEVDRDEEADPVPIGRPLPGVRAFILDRHGLPVPPGGAGELFVGGPGLANGYRGAPGATAERFVPDPSGHGDRLYRTGDFACLDVEGRLRFLGRGDRQVKIRGHRVELGEIERELERHPGVRQAALAVRPGNAGRVRLVAYYEAESTAEPSSDDITAWLSGRLPAEMIPGDLVRLDRFPLTRNGKIDHRALPEPEPAEPGGRALRGTSEDPVAEPATPTERALAGIWSEVLDVDHVGLDDDYLALGGDSILAIVVVAKAQQAGFMLSAQDLFEAPTLRRLAERVAVVDVDQVEAGPIAREAVADGAHPLSPMQQAMLFHALEESTTADYLVQIKCRLEGDVDAEGLRYALQRLTDRHAVLRSAVRISDAGTEQIVQPTATPPIEEVDLTPVSAEEQRHRLAEYLREDRRRGMDLTRAPLFRVALFRIGESVHDCVLTHHHILLDGWSQQLMLRELLDLYDGEVPREQEAPNAFFAHLDQLAQAETSDSERFWRDRLKGFTPQPMFSVRRPAQPDVIEQDLSLTLVEQPRSGEDRGLTLGTMVQGCWSVLLAELSGTDDVVLGLTVAGRPPDLPGATEALGMFINTLPVRVQIPIEQEPLEWLADLQRRGTELWLHQNTPLPLIERVSAAPHDRLFESIVVVENFPTFVEAGHESRRLRVVEASVSVVEGYPLVVEVRPGPPARLLLRYNSAAVPVETAEWLSAGLAELLQVVSTAPPDRVGDLLALAAERRRASRGDRLRGARRRPAEPGGEHA
jgi:amino acid adenylation domain-containing protein